MVGDPALRRTRFRIWHAAAAGLVILVLAVGSAIALLYRTAYAQQLEHLDQVLFSQARLIESVARFDQRAAQLSPGAYDQGAKEATLEQVLTAFNSYEGFGETGEFVLGYRDADGWIHLAQHQRTEHNRAFDHVLPGDGAVATPMQRALRGESGSGRLVDYRGADVLAAYEPLEGLDMGLVVKVDMAEVRRPFVRAALLAVGITAFLVGIGWMLAARRILPTVRRIRELDSVMRKLAAGGPGLVYRASRDTRRRLTLASEGATGFLGYSALDLVAEGGMNLDELTHPDDRALVRAEIRAALDHKSPLQVSYRLRAADGSERWVQDYAEPAVWDGADVFFGVMLDITDAKKVELERDQFRGALESQRREFRNVVTRATTGIIVVDEDGTVLYANPAACALLGRHESSIEGTPLGIPVSGPSVVEIEVRRPDGGTRLCEMSVTGTEWDERRAYLTMMHDVTERREAEAALERMAFHDALTGIANRTRFNQRTQEAVSRCGGRRGTRVAVIFIDLDRFKLINDTLGHKMGDELLRAVAGRIGGLLRSSDLVARVGGDEFAVLALVENRDAAIGLAERIRSVLSEPILIAEHELSAECSVGVSVCPDDAEDAESLVRFADAAMYAAKAAGRNAVRAFSPEHETELATELMVREHMRAALVEEQFVVYYQPQIELAGDRLSGFEALLRWNHPERGLLAPDVFLGALEQTGQIEAVGNWVLEHAMRQTAEWNSRLPSPVKISVNLAAHQLRHAGLVSTVKHLLSVTGLEPSCLMLEITESTAISNLHHSRSVLALLRQQGIGIALDDFGKGYSSLSYLHQLPVDVIKIDRQFVRDIPGNGESAALARAIIAMAHGLGKKVTAEGVETAEQAEFLRAEGCDTGQGYLYGRPEPQETIDARWIGPAARQLGGGSR